MSRVISQNVNNVINLNNCEVIWAKAFWDRNFNECISWIDSTNTRQQTIYLKF